MFIPTAPNRAKQSTVLVPLFATAVLIRNQAQLSPPCKQNDYHLPQSSAGASSAFFFASPPLPARDALLGPAGSFRAAAAGAAALEGAGADESHSSSSHVASVQQYATVSLQPHPKMT